MTIGELCALFRRERRRFARARPHVARARLELDDRAPKSPRAAAYAEGSTIALYARALELPRANLTALVRHELAHVALRRRRHTEREADHLAELVGGQAISYDACDVQTVGRGRRPRPRGLR